MGTWASRGTSKSGQEVSNERGVWLKNSGASRAGRRETVELKTFLFSRALTTACNQREAIPQRHRASPV